MCDYAECVCHKLSFRKPGNGGVVDHESVLLLVDELFRAALQLPRVLRNKTEFEHLSLKYVSYLAKYRNNTVMAYFELKMLLSSRKNSSFYFKSISKILSQTIEEQMT